MEISIYINQKIKKIKYFEMLTEILEYMQATFTYIDFHIYKP